MNNAYIKEAFVSLQGEGKYVGVRQLFIRFSDCDINCSGCDTDFSRKDTFELLGKKFSNPADLNLLISHIEESGILKSIHSISFTGGEPLLNRIFIKEFISNLGDKTKFFLETSGYHLNYLKEIYHLLDIVSMDIKLHSSFGVKNNIEQIKKESFVDNKKTYFKLILDDKTSEDELKMVIELLSFKGFDEIFIHFKNNLFNFSYLGGILKKFYNSGITARYVPQIHKFLKVR